MLRMNAISPPTTTRNFFHSPINPTSNIVPVSTNVNNPIVIDRDNKDTELLFDDQDDNEDDSNTYLDKFLDHLSLLHYKPLFKEAGIATLDQLLTLTESQLEALLGKGHLRDLYILTGCIDILKNHNSHTKHMTSTLYQYCNKDEDEVSEHYEEDHNDKDVLIEKSSNLKKSRFNGCLNLNKKQHDSTTSHPVQQEIDLEPIIIRRRKKIVQLESTNGSSSSSSSSSGNNNNYLSCFNQRPLSMPIQLPSYVVTPPPDYMMTPTAILGRKLDRCRSMLVPTTPREEDGKEDLPDYSCTVFKMGYVYIKKEYDMPDVKSKWRIWRKLYVELWGTMLRIYRAAPKKRKQQQQDSVIEDFPWPFKLPYQYYHRYYYCPLFSISLAGAEATRALDYFRRPHVLRLTTQHGPQMLMRLPSHVDMISWIEHLQAAINISLDLEHRPMPKFITLQTRGLAASALDTRAIELERAREQRRRDQHEVLI